MLAHIYTVMLSLSFHNHATSNTCFISSNITYSFLSNIYSQDTIIHVMELTSVLDSVVSQFTIANLIYKIVGHEASAKGWFATGN